MSKNSHLLLTTSRVSYIQQQQSSILRPFEQVEKQQIEIEEEQLEQLALDGYGQHECLVVAENTCKDRDWQQTVNRKLEQHHTASKMLVLERDAGERNKIGFEKIEDYGELEPGIIKAQSFVYDRGTCSFVLTKSKF